MRTIATRFVVIVTMVLGIAVGAAAPAFADGLPPAPYYSHDDHTTD